MRNRFNLGLHNQVYSSQGKQKLTCGLRCMHPNFFTQHLNSTLFFWGGYGQFEDAKKLNQDIKTMKYILLLALFIGCVSTKDCASQVSRFKTNVRCPYFEKFNEPGGTLQEVTSKYYSTLKGSFSMAHLEIKPGCLRQLHWHSQGELAFVLRGSAGVGVIGPEEKDTSFFTVKEGEAWYVRTFGTMS